MTELPSTRDARLRVDELAVVVVAAGYLLLVWAALTCLNRRGNEAFFAEARACRLLSEAFCSERRKAAARAHQLLEAAPISVVIVTEEGRYLYRNPTHNALYGYPHDEAPTFTRDMWVDPSERARLLVDALDEVLGLAAAAREALVVVHDDLSHRAIALDALDELRALLRVELDELPLVVRELAVRE